jgi:hypothetical protein
MNNNVMDINKFLITGKFGAFRKPLTNYLTKDSEIWLAVVDVVKQTINKTNPNGVALGMDVYHMDVYHGRERMKVVGIREKEVELEGDYSGGTHNVTQRFWEKIEGLRSEKQPFTIK